MNLRCALIAAAFATLAGQGPAAALPLHYDELVDGDLADDIMDSEFHDLGVGANSITGAVRFSIEEGPYMLARDAFDHIGLIVPEHTEVRAIRLSIHATDDGTAQFRGLTPYLSLYPSPVVSYPIWQVPNGQEIFLPVQDQPLFEGLLPLPYRDEPIHGVVMPLGPGNYVLGTGGLGGNGEVGEHRVAAYRFDLQVAEVPLPAAGLLLPVALGVIALLRRRLEWA